ncbi:hypothetical protein WAK64_08945 [Bacillus spongiae]|uniref:DUF3939 domain-containing protein n=1 Tax=Bacillus spongiae TaxID=2683610 RepID=A0ABU8HDD4_9BACI
MKRFSQAFVSMMVLVLLSGCLYPEEQLAQNQIPYEEQIESVQAAINQFKEEENGLLPIKTKEHDTPVYRKYPIDFSKIVPRYMASSPSNSFEKGGIFQYVLIDVEENPTVKLIDLRIPEKIKEIQMRIRSQGYPPMKELIGDNVYTLDFAKLGYKEDPFVVSPFSGVHLPFVITGKGDLYVDYRQDIYMKLEDKMSIQTVNEEDIRSVLLEGSHFVPAYSLPYVLNEKNEPDFNLK